MENLRILFIALYSDNYPSIGESHGLSVVAGSVVNKCSDYTIDYFEVMDMVALGDHNIAQIIDKITLNKPNVIGISINYGTYYILQDIIKGIHNFIESTNPLVLFGGAIATYIPEIILKNIYSKSIIILGEGDEATPMVIRSWFEKSPIGEISNLCYKSNDKVIYTVGKLVSINKMSSPYREHIDSIVSNKAQVYLESSRGCSWAGCSFCLRGLTDLKGYKTEYRRLNFIRTSLDIIRLAEHGVRVFTFADEDFLGGKIHENEIFVDEFENFCLTNELGLSFDASLTVHSIFSNKFSEAELERIQLQLKRLKGIGLRKVFLGIESGSDSQLKRYDKGHTSHEAISAIKILRNIGFELELGFIMFDPLCSLTEIEENIDFLNKNDLIKYVSFLSSELRLQVKSKYLRLLKKQESVNNKVLFNRTLDYNTLSYNYYYNSEDVANLVKKVKFWNSRIRDIHYPLKNLSRYGKGGILMEHREKVVDIITNLRNEYFQLLKRLIFEIKSNQIQIINDKSIDKVIYITSIEIIELSKDLPLDIIENHIFNAVIKTCNTEIDNFIRCNVNDI